MGDWRMQGSAMRRRQGAPTDHRSGANKAEIERREFLASQERYYSQHQTPGSPEVLGFGETSRSAAPSNSGGRPPIAANPQTPEEKGKKGYHVRQSTHAKVSKN